MKPSTKPIPLSWGKALTLEEQKSVKLLRDNGCDCDLPTLGFSRDHALTICFNCATVVDSHPPIETEEDEHTFEGVS